MNLIKNYRDYLFKILPINLFNYNLNNIILTVKLNKIIPIFTFLKYHTNCQYKILTDICVIDNPLKNKRFEIIYNLLSLSYNSRIFIKVLLNENETIDSISNIFINSIWIEREIWDMFGIFFFKHPDLRRILTDYGFEGFPLRKDFPLSGFIEVRYDDLKKRVVYENLKISQDFRYFNFESPWGY